MQQTEPPYTSPRFAPCRRLLYIFCFTALLLGARATLPTPSYAQKNELSGSPLNNSSLLDSAKLLPSLVLNRLSPSLDWFLDPSGQLTIEQILSPAIQRSFSSFLFTKLPKKEGVFWFRFTLDSTARLKLPDLVLDLNKRTPGQFPGKPKVWIASMGSEKARLLAPISENVFPIKHFGSEIIDVYIQMSGAPGFGFNPTLLSKEYFLNLYPAIEKAARLFLIAAIIICVARGIIEKQEWRFWSAIYPAAILIHTLWGLPETSSGALTILDMPGLLSPGIALFTLAHIGRHLMQTRRVAPGLDAQLTLLAFPGLVISIFPLFPGYLWTLPYLSVWPIIAAAFLPTTVSAIKQKIKNAKLFLWIWAQLPLSLLALALPTSVIPQSLSLEIINSLPLALLSGSCMTLALAGKTKRRFTSIQPLSVHRKILTGYPSEQNGNLDDQAIQALKKNEQKLRLSLNRIIKELASLNPLIKPDYLKQHIENIENTAEYLNNVLNEAPELFRSNENAEEIFDLTQVLLNAHNAVEKEAEEKNLALSWFIAPHMPKQYKGNKLRLTQALYLLVENAVRSTNKGVIQLRAQRVAESADPGSILLTVSIAGEIAPRINRDSLAIVQAWDLAHTSDGTLYIKSSPKETEISFSVKLTAVQTTPDLKTLPEQQRVSLSQIQRILIADSSQRQRQLLTYYLDDLPYEIVEAKNFSDVCEAYKSLLSSLIIFGPETPENDIVEAIGYIRVFEGDHDFPPAPILAVCKTDEQAERLLRIGCTHTLIEPISKKKLRSATLRLAPVTPRVMSVFNKIQTTSLQNNSEPLPRAASSLLGAGQSYGTNKNSKDPDAEQNLPRLPQTPQNLLENSKGASKEHISDPKNASLTAPLNAEPQINEIKTSADAIESPPLNDELENLNIVENPLNKKSKRSPSIEYPPLEEPIIQAEKPKEASFLSSEKQNVSKREKVAPKVKANKETKLGQKPSPPKDKTSLPLLDIIDIAAASKQESAPPSDFGPAINEGSSTPTAPGPVDALDEKSVTNFDGEAGQEERRSSLNMANLFDSTLRFIEGENPPEVNKELFNELELTLRLLQQALLSNQSENLEVFPQVIETLANQLRLQTVAQTSQRILRAIRANEHSLLEGLVGDLTAEIAARKARFIG